MRLAALLLAAIVAPVSAQLASNNDYDPPTHWATLTGTGTSTIRVTAGKHRAEVTMTIAKAGNWPEAMRIGPSAGDNRGDGIKDRIVTGVTLKVDGCEIDQPWPRIAGMASPSTAHLFFVKGYWQLEIGGSDGAEAYSVHYAFNGRRVVAREMMWGPDLSERTTYTIESDPDVSPQQCDAPTPKGRRPAR